MRVSHSTPIVMCVNCSRSTATFQLIFGFSKLCEAPNVHTIFWEWCVICSSRVGWGCAVLMVQPCTRFVAGCDAAKSVSIRGEYLCCCEYFICSFQRSFMDMNGIAGSFRLVYSRNHSTMLPSGSAKYGSKQRPPHIMHTSVY